MADQKATPIPPALRALIVQQLAQALAAAWQKQQTDPQPQRTA